MITVKNLRERLVGLNDDDRVYAYEGEATGIVIVRRDEDGKYNELCFIEAANTVRDENK